MKAGHLFSFYPRLISNADNNVTFGLGGTGTWLANNQSNSFMVGYNSDAPTFYVSPATGSGTSGNVGIGGSGYAGLTTPDPIEKLEIWNGNIAQTNVDLVANTTATSGNSSTNLLGSTGGTCNVFGLTTNNYSATNPIPGIANTFLQIGIDGSTSVLNYDDTSSLIFNSIAGLLCANTYNPIMQLNGISSTYQVEEFGDGYILNLAKPPDISFKSNIKPINNLIEIISKYNGKSYNYNVDKYPKYNFSNGINYGFLAQEVKEFMPEIVRSNEDGYNALNYIAIIPLLVEAVKYQQEIIDSLRQFSYEPEIVTTMPLIVDSIALDSLNIKLSEQKLQIDTMNQVISYQTEMISEFSDKLNSILICLNKNNLCSQSKIKDLNQKPTSSNEPWIFQNSPNPFNGVTEINYFLPEISHKGSVLIFDELGHTIQLFDNLQAGINSITFVPRNVFARIYYYKFIVDDKIIATKKMQLCN
jgi:hypothetical protein